MHQCQGTELAYDQCIHTGIHTPHHVFDIHLLKCISHKWGINSIIHKYTPVMGIRYNIH